jgi:hypothetical protein
MHAHARTHARTHTHTQKYVIFIYHGNNDFLNALQCSIISTLLNTFKLSFSVTLFIIAVKFDQLLLALLMFQVLATTEKVWLLYKETSPVDAFHDR